MKKVYIVGIGMEGRQTLTQQAQEAIDSADCLIGAERMLKPFSDRVSGLQPSAIREILKFTADPEVISFAAGNPAPTLTPCLCPATVDTSAVQRIS